MEEYKINYKSSKDVTISAKRIKTENPKCIVIMAHGINADKEEDGLFTELAHELAFNHCDSLTFDYRGHGESTGNQEKMTIEGETIDLKKSIEYVKETTDLPIIVLAASFGAVSTLNYIKNENSSYISKLILLNPVLDLNATFIKPTLPWGKKNFHKEAFEKLEELGYIYLDETFKVGYRLLDEMKTIFPYKILEHISIPTLVIHGNKDTYVSYDISKKYSEVNQWCDFVTVNNSEHGFGRIEEKKYVIQTIIKWLM
ncbi:MAG: alpha/beta hydrolase [Clostridia bacterium]|nr:alpha/beta hydrolase [Clostridia bacterium]